MEGVRPSIAVAKRAISDLITADQPTPVTVDNIINEVARTFDVSASDIRSAKKSANISLARQVAMYIARETTELTYKAIGQCFGKDHTTVLYNVTKIEEFLKDKPYQRELVEDIIKNLKSNNDNAF